MIVSSFTIKFNGDGDAFAVPILAFGLPLPRPAEHPAPSPSAADAFMVTTFLAEFSRPAITDAQVRQGVPFLQFDSYFTLTPCLSSSSSDAGQRHW